MLQKETNWNLNDLFTSEEELKKYSLKCIKNAISFKKSYENTLAKIDKTRFKSILIEYEGLLLQISKIMTYAYLAFAEDTSKGAFLAQCESECKKAEENLLFFELEFCDLEESKALEFIKETKGYEFYLQNLLKNKKHRLSKAEERVILHLSSTGANAFSRLFDESLSRMKINFDGKKVSEEEILSKLYSTKRQTRKKAARSFTKALSKQNDLLVFILNMIKTELHTKCELRAYKNAEESRHISNQTTQKSVDSLIKTTEKHFDLVSLFYEKKRQILKLIKLKDYDRYAPVGKEMSFEFEKSKEIILCAFKAFSPRFSNIAKEAFTKNWIDVYPKKFKRSGAFSHSATPDAHPYILLNYTGKHRDLFTLAHELGHSIHQKLSYKVSFLKQDTPLTTAETASVFAEMLVFDYLKEKLSDEEKISIYASKIEDIFATLFRQINFTTFERRIHAYEGELSKEKINQIWLEESQKMFQNSVKLTKNYALWWSYIPHFIHSPFYCYAYAYAQLLVLALYGLYKSGKCKNFVRIYLNMLSSGGSKSPRDLISAFGFDIEDKSFWELGIKEIRKLIDEFMELKV